MSHPHSPPAPSGLRLVLPIGLLLCSCSTEDPLPQTDAGGTKAQEGEACKVSIDCRWGLLCAGSGTCQLTGAEGTRTENEACASERDCLMELVCSSEGLCRQPGNAGEGESCTGGEDCALGLVCSSAKRCAQAGAPGTKGVEEPCAEPDECALGLVCVAQSCAQLSFWGGVSCAPDDDTSGAFRAYFEVPRSGEPVEEFYRLPFPNDIRRHPGGLDLRGHPNPATAIPGEYGDVIGRTFEALSEDLRGFGLNTTIFFRMSQAFDMELLEIDFRNIDPDSTGYGTSPGYQLYATSGRGKYICQNYIAARQPVGHPLAPATTYAVMLKKGIKTGDGTLAVQDEDFQLMLADTAPITPDLLAAWQAYAPLRAYLAAQGIDPASILSAAVFTTMDPQAKMSRFRQVIIDHAEPPQVNDLTLCDGVASAPCAKDDPEHYRCGDPDPAFFELQGSYQTPAFQQGTPPFATPAEGGSIAYDSAGDPLVQRHEAACFALTVPKAEMPEAGWPLVIFAHGTGGSYRSFITNGTAAALAEISGPQGEIARLAAISIDGAMHGARRGSDQAPDGLFFNLRNPRAARDNVYQGAADKLQLLRLVQALNLEVAASPTGQPLRFDPERIYYFGHSQGAIEGIPFASHAPEIKGVVLSGAGGYLIGSLLGKTKPQNVAGMVQLALADGNLGSMHPLLNLLQLFYEEVDAINYGKALFAAPPEGLAPKHTFLGYGVADSFTPPGTIDALAWAMGIPQLRQAAQRCGDGVCNGSESCLACAADCGACPEGAVCGDGSCSGGERCSTCQEDCGACDPPFPLIEPPVCENREGGGGKVTAALVQYVSDGSYDDHFVLFEHPAGQQQSLHFLGTAARDGAPTIPAAAP